MLIKELTDRARMQMAKVVETLEDELRTMRAGKATPALVEKVEVEAYGERFRLIELAQITTPEKNQLLIQPYDPGIVGNVNKAIELADLGLNPQVDGGVVRVVIPTLTEERRQELVKAVRRQLESTRVMVRQIRQQMMDEIEEAFKGKGIGEDERYRLRDVIQKIVDEKNKEIEEIGRAREEELMAV